jgi:urea transport system substrate-binding protein
MSRRDWLKVGSASVTLAAAQGLFLSGCQNKDSKKGDSKKDGDGDKEKKGDPKKGSDGDKGGEIKVGIMHSLSGFMKISEESLKDVELMAISEINEAGGVLGKKIKPIIEDPASDFENGFPEKAKKLLLKDEVVAVFGCWTSASRKSVLKIFEKNNGLLFYPVQYEGNECSKNVIYTGAAPNQQILPAIDYLWKEMKKRKFYLLGSDYVFPRTANQIIEAQLKNVYKATPVATKYADLKEKDFTNIVQDIKAKDPDVIFSTINGDSNLPFYNELAARGITAAKVPVVAVSVAEDELRGLDPKTCAGHMAAWNYFQSVKSPANDKFVKAFKDFTKDEKRVTDDPIEAAYFQVYLWKLAVEKAGSTDVDKVREAIRGIEFDAPEGKVKVDGTNNHTYKKFRLGKINANRQFDIVYETPEWVRPNPYPKVAYSKECDWIKHPKTGVVDLSGS